MLKRAARQASSPNCSAPIRYCINDSRAVNNIPNTTYSCYFFMSLHSIVIFNDTWNATVDGNTTATPAATCVIGVRNK